MWPFTRKPKVQPPIDARNWNEDWKVGDTAEVVVGDWHEVVRPWERLAVGDQFTVVGFSEGMARGGKAKYYFLHLKGLERSYTTQCFRKVRSVSAEESEVVSRILNAKPGTDRTRETAERGA